MKKFIIISLLATLFFSCSPQKRLDNLLRKNPELIQDSVLYNVKVKDTLYLNYSFADSVVFVKDTVFEPTIVAQVKTQNAQATIIQNPNKSLRLVAESLPDTIIHTVEKNVYIPKVIYYNKPGKMTYFQSSLSFRRFCLVRNCFNHSFHDFSKFSNANYQLSTINYQLSTK